MEETKKATHNNYANQQDRFSYTRIQNLLFFMMSVHNPKFLGHSMKKNNNLSPMGIFLVVLKRTKEQLYWCRALPQATAKHSEKEQGGNHITIFLWWILQKLSNQKLRAFLSQGQMFVGFVIFVLFFVFVSVFCQYTSLF